MQWWQMKKRDADLERELRSDLELEEEEQRDRGVSPEEARYTARRAFGNTTLIKEQTRETWGWAPLERFYEDVRFGLRMQPVLGIDGSDHRRGPAPESVFRPVREADRHALSDLVRVAAVQPSA